MNIYYKVRYVNQNEKCGYYVRNPTFDKDGVWGQDFVCYNEKGINSKHYHRGGLWRFIEDDKITPSCVNLVQLVTNKRLIAKLNKIPASALYEEVK
jgi:hypothetical protein